MFGLSNNGFKKMRYSDIISSMEQRARNLYGEDINLTERSPLGIFIQVVAWFLSIIWEVAERVYNSAYVDTATGVNLDKVAKYIGIVRIGAEKAVGEVTFFGDDGTLISEGFLVQTEDGVQFETTESGMIDAGEITLSVRAMEAGTSGNVQPNTINEILNPIAGLDTVTNVFSTEQGGNKETDTEFRERYYISTAKGGASTLASIRATLLDEVAGVRAALVIENTTMETDEGGRPPKSIECYLLGGQAVDIGNVILNTKAAGIESFGQESIMVPDLSGQEHLIKFSYAQEVPVYISVEVNKTEAYPIDGDEKLRNAIIRYIGGQDEDGSVYAGLSMGQTVVYHMLVNRIYQAVQGIQDIVLYIDTVTPPTGSGNISVTQTQVAETDFEKVVISHV